MSKEVNSYSTKEQYYNSNSSATQSEQKSRTFLQIIESDYMGKGTYLGKLARENNGRSCNSKSSRSSCWCF